MVTYNFGFATITWDTIRLRTKFAAVLQVDKEFPLVEDTDDEWKELEFQTMMGPFEKDLDPQLWTWHCCCPEGSQFLSNSPLRLDPHPQKMKIQQIGVRCSVDDFVGQVHHYVYGSN